MDASTNSKKRKRNFGPGEIEVLLAGVEANIDTLNSSFTNSVTNASKKKIWSDITQKINASGTAARNEEEIRKKWTDLKAAVKKAESGRRENQRKTGGGPPPDELSSMEKRILQLIPRCAVEGIPGGIESPVPDFREESNCTFGSGTQAEEIEVDMCLGRAVDAFENDSQTALTPNSEAQSCLPEPAYKGDDYKKTLSGYEDRKGQLLEGILCELKSLREIQQERLNLEIETFQFMQTMDSNSLLSSIIKF